MTIGIYELKFSDGSTYIGQSENVEKRWVRHLYTLKNNAHHNKFVQNKYNSLGCPKTILLEECNIESLYPKEIQYAKAVTKNLLLNMSEPGQKTTKLWGTLNGRSKYSREDILDILFSLANSNISKKELAEFSPISYSTIRQISAGTTNLWLKEEFPIEWKRMVEKTKKNPIYKVKTPKGEILDVVSQRDFVKHYPISLSSLNRLITKKVISVKGWTLAE